MCLTKSNLKRITSIILLGIDPTSIVRRSLTETGIHNTLIVSLYKDSALIDECQLNMTEVVGRKAIDGSGMGALDRLRTRKAALSKLSATSAGRAQFQPHIFNT